MLTIDKSHIQSLLPTRNEIVVSGHYLIFKYPITFPFKTMITTGEFLNKQAGGWLVITD